MRIEPVSGFVAPWAAGFDEEANVHGRKSKAFDVKSQDQISEALSVWMGAERRIEFETSELFRYQHAIGAWPEMCLGIELTPTSQKSLKKDA
jgi:hypothetical protein